MIRLSLSIFTTYGHAAPSSAEAIENHPWEFKSAPLSANLSFPPIPPITPGFFADELASFFPSFCSAFALFVRFQCVCLHVHTHTPYLYSLLPPYHLVWPGLYGWLRVPDPKEEDPSIHYYYRLDLTMDHSMDNVPMDQHPERATSSTTPRKFSIRSNFGKARQPRSRKNRPCDACRRRKTACVITAEPPCERRPIFLFIHSSIQINPTITVTHSISSLPLNQSNYSLPF